MKKVSTLAVIPARGGSKRIPHKNIVEFFGKPLIAWTIEAAVKSGVFDRIIVSTDDDEIAEASKRYGAEVPFLRDKHSDEHSPVSLATVTALNQLREILSEEYQNVVQLMANCPLRNHIHIVEAYNHFKESNGDFQISCFKYGWMNPWWANKLNSDFIPSPVFPETLKNNVRSQDLPTLYCPTGAIWIARVPALMKSNSFYGHGYTFFPLDWKAAVDIDDYEDLEMAQAVFSLVNKNIHEN